MYHGLGLNLYRLYQRLRQRILGPKRRPDSALGQVASGVFTFHFVCIGWVLFLCDLDRAGLIIARLMLLR
jgi:D-alanyl-lipoteichoic acid acyltransferase DltB (MBOAT superfamily)